MIMRKPFLQFASFLLLLGLLAGCDLFSSDDDAEARLRLYNGSPDAGPIDLFVNGELKGFSIPFTRAIGYVPVPAEANVSIAIRRAGATLAEQTAVLEAEQQYSLYALGPVSALRHVLLKEKPVPASDGSLTGTSRLRLLHGSTSAGAVDFYVLRVPVGGGAFEPDLSNASPLYAGVNFGDVTPEALVDVSVESGSTLGNSFVIVSVPSGSKNVNEAHVRIDRGLGVNTAFLTLLYDAPDSLTQQLGPNAQMLPGVAVAD
jgi:hypothetical protein